MPVIITRCWHCGKVSNRARISRGQSIDPKDGDVNLCVYCGKLAIFDSSMPDGARKPSPSEQDELQTDADLFAVQMAWQRAFGSATEAE